MAVLSSRGDADVPHEESLYNDQDVGSSSFPNTQAVLLNPDSGSSDSELVEPMDSTFNEEMAIFDGEAVGSFSVPRLRRFFSEMSTPSIEVLFDQICKLEGFGDSLELLVDCVEHLGSSEEKILFTLNIISVIMDHICLRTQDEDVERDWSEELLNFLSITRNSIIVAGQCLALDGSCSVDFARELTFLLDVIYSLMKMIRKQAKNEIGYIGDRWKIRKRLSRLLWVVATIELHPQKSGFSLGNVIKITRKTLLDKAYELWEKAKCYLNDDESHSELTPDKRNMLAVLYSGRSCRLITHLLVFIPWEGTSDSSTQDLMVADLEKIYTLGFEILKISESQNLSLPFFKYIKALLNRTNEIREEVMKKSRAGRYLTSFLRHGYHCK
jgi:hypothetical protein